MEAFHHIPFISPNTNLVVQLVHGDSVCSNQGHRHRLPLIYKTDNDLGSGDHHRAVTNFVTIYSLRSGATRIHSSI